MAKVVGDIAVEVSADIGPLQRGLRRAGDDLDGFGDRAAKMSIKAAKAGAAVAAGLAVVGVASYNIVKSAAAAGAEIERLSQIAGVTPEKFQKMAAASKTVGIENEKLADILKDVQDRVGDFIATGGGPMKDFFENIAPLVGVTAENFRDLNSADALQLYVSSLEKAGANQNEMAFYLEAMSSDLTNLLPLLRDGGAEMTRMGDAAAEAGAVMSNEAVNGSMELQRQLENLTAGIRTQFTQAILENKDEISALVTTITNDWIPALIKVAEFIAAVIGKIGDAIQAYRNFREAIAAPFSAPTFDVDPMQNVPGIGARTGAGDMFEGVPQSDIDALMGGGGDTSIKGGSGSDVFGFVSSKGAMNEEAERLTDHMATLRDIVSDGLSQKYDLLSEGYAREVDLAKDTADAEVRVEEMKRDEKLRAVAGAFGELSTLMLTENDKLFKIGKAAAIAEATVSGYKAAVDAWEKGMAVGGPGVAAAFTAASLARTGALISNIASQQIGGGSSGSGGGGGAGAAAAPAPLQARLSLVGSGEFIRKTDLGDLLDQLTDEAGDRGYTLMVAQ